MIDFIVLVAIGDTEYDVTDHFINDHIPTADETWWSGYDYCLRSVILD